MATNNKRFVAKNGLDNNNQTITNLGASGNSLGLSGTGDLTIAISGTATLTIPSGSDTLVTLSGAQTLTNKTISGSNNTISNIGNGSLTNSSVSFNGVTVSLGASGTLYTDDISEDGTPVNLWFTNSRARAAISITDSGGDGSLSYDSGTGIITYTGPSATEVRAHLSAGTGLTYTTGQFAIDSTVVTLTGTQTLENKTLTTPVISAITNTGTLTLPISTDTLVGRATTDTLSNKTISGASNTISNIGNGSLTNSSITINGTSVSLGGTRTLVTDDIAEDGSPVNLWYTDTRARNAISVTDAGGDGSLSYSSGVITYTGPSASEVRAHFSAGTGVTITSGQVAIGQAVATTDNVTFAGVTADNVRVGVTAAGEIDTSTGNLTIDSAGGTTTIDDDATVTGNLQVDGNLTVSGTTVTINATNLAIEDNMIYLNNGSTVSHPDLGFAGNYNDGTYRHAGLFRDATDGVWKFFHQYTPEPDASAFIDTAHGSFALAPIQASSFTGSVTGNASTATTWQTARTLSLTGDVTGTSAAFDGSGNISITTTIAADSVALGTDTTGNYVASITNGNYLTGGNGGSEGAALTLAVDATSANTASKVVARDASGNFSAGTITATLSGNASTVTNGVYTTDTGTVTNTMLAGSIANNKLANSTISGISLGGNLATLTLDVSGTGLSGSQTYNGSSAATFTVTSNATSANTASTIVARDASGNFTAGTITAALSGNATSATNSTTTSQRAFSSDISTTGQGRFTGWYTGNAATGLAAEIGISGGEGYVFTYNRDTSTYGTMNFAAASANLKISGSTINATSGALQQGGNQVLHAGNYNSYSPTLTGTGASGTWGISISGNAATATSATSASSASEATYAFRLFSADLRTIAPNSHAAYRATFGFTSWANNNSAPYADYIHLRSYSDSSGGSDNLIMFLKSGIGVRIWQQSFNSGTAYSSYVDVLHSGNYGSYALPLSGGTLTGVVRLNSSAYFTADGTYGYRFNSSTDAFNNVIFYDNGNVYIRTSLGVGTSTPTFALSVAGTIQSIGAGTDSVAGGPASVYLGDGSAGTMLRHTASRHFAIDTYSSGSTWIERIRVERDGNVGIGTSSPSTLLHVKASGNYGTIVSDNSTNTGGGAFGVRKNGSAIGFLLNKGSWYGDTSNDLCVAAETGYNFRIYTNGSASEKFIFTTGGALGIGTTSPATTLDVRGGILRTNSRVASDQNYPLGHYTPGETVFEIDPTWSQSELQEFFGSSGVSWVSDSTAPGGYAIQVSGGVYVGGVYNAGFPYIPVDQDDVFMMECWIKDVAGTNGHYMGSIDFNASFSSLGGNPGSFGYWVMLANSPGTSWTRYVGYIGGFGSSTGQFVSGTKYWTPQALFNYIGGGTSYISGWKAIKVSHRGNHRFLNNVGIGGGHAPDVALSVNGVVHIGNGGNFVYMGGTVGSSGSWGSRHYTSGGNNVNNANTFQFDNVGYGSTWTVTFNSSGITASGNITAYSDIRLKENIMKIENALDKVQQLRGITYTRNDTDDTTKRHAGVIAQEVEQVLPEVVDETSSGIKHVAYGNMIGLLIEAIKELKHDNEQLHRRIQQWEDNS